MMSFSRRYCLDASRVVFSGFDFIGEEFSAQLLKPVLDEFLGFREALFHAADAPVFALRSRLSIATGCCWDACRREPCQRESCAVRACNALRELSPAQLSF